MAKPKKMSAAAMKKLQGAFGKENVANLNEGPSIVIERIPSGSLDLDRILGGGWPKGRISELYSESSGGKSSLASTAISQVQKLGEVAAMVDMEASYDPDYGESLGVDNDALIYSAPDSGEEALDIVEALALTGEVSLIVLDSSNACITKAELEGEMADNSIAAQARMFAKAMRKLVQACKKHGTALIIISQVKMKITGFGDPRSIGIGRSIYYADSIRLEILADKPLEKGGLPYGHKMRFLTVKNKTFRPKLRGAAFFEYYKGFCNFTEVLDLAVDLGIAEKKGAWFAYSGTNIGQGIEKSAAILKDNPELYEELHEKVLEGLKQQ